MGVVLRGWTLSSSRPWLRSRWMCWSWKSVTVWPPAESSEPLRLSICSCRATAASRAGCPSPGAVSFLFVLIWQIQFAPPSLPSPPALHLPLASPPSTLLPGDRREFVTSDNNQMLGQTKKSSSMRRSAKLPKLNIQQQIENQEIADRMNRKVTFARNPRHLNHTITYATALTNNSLPSAFRPEPHELRFNDYEPLHLYEAELRLVNTSRYIQRIKVAPLRSRDFTIAEIRYPREDCGDIAPGMAVVIAVRFRPPGLGDYEDELVVVAGEGTVRVPIVALRERCEINWPTAVSCGHCWVGDVIKKEVVLRNKGGEARFSLVGADGTAPLRRGFFSLSPTDLAFEKNTQTTLAIEFAPQQQGVFKEAIRFKSHQGDQEEIEVTLEGGAYSAQIVLEEMDGEQLLEPRVQNTLYLRDTEMGRPTSASLKVRNLAVVQVDYFWHFQSPALAISAPRGKMKPSELLPFHLTLTPSQKTPELIRLQLYLFNLPEKSLPGSVTSRNINGVEAIQCLTVDLRTRPAQSNIEVFPLHRQIVQPIFENCPVTENVTLVNRSSVRRTFRIDKVREEEGVAAAALEAEGILEPNSEKVIGISFHLGELTASSKFAYFLASFDNAPSQVFSLEGVSTYPDVLLQDELVYFGLCKTFTLNRRRLRFRNPQHTPVQFRVHNPHRFYQLDFYDFYEFEDETSYKRRLNLYRPETGEEAVDWVTVPPEGTVELECVLNALQEESVELGLEVEVRRGRRWAVRVEAEVQEVRVQLSRPSIHLREIYKGNIYNSNKFLSKELQLVNRSHHDAAFDIDPPAFDHCDLRIEPLKGIVKANSTQRLDLILEPIRTGDFDLRVQWKYFDDFKANPDLYMDLADRIQFNAVEGGKSLFTQQELQLTGTIRGMAMNYYLKDETRAKRVRVKIEDLPQSVKLSASSLAASMKSSKNLLENEKVVYPPLEELNFYNCEINQVRQVEIIIENDSGLTTEYEVYAENFRTLEKYNEFDRKSQKGLIKVEEQAFSSEMGKTFVRNKALDRSQKVHLGNNKGISVLCEPASGTLNKKQSQRILITMFNDTSGRFRDNLLINVKNHEIKKIPMDIHIKGTPVSLSRNQLGIDFAQELPLMHLGTLLHSNGLVKRTLKVVNNGPKEVQLKWLVYPYNKNTNDRDIFAIEFKEAAPGNGNIVDLNWNAIKPEVDAASYLSIEPKERRVKGREEVTFTVLIQEIKEVGPISNLLICEPSMVEGATRTAMESLAVVVATETIAPLLTMDTKHKNHINKLEKFAVPPQDYQTNAANHIRKLKLKNSLKANLTFDIAVTTKDPKLQAFKLVDAKTNSPATSLLSATATAAQTAFCLTYDSILEVAVELVASPSNLGEWPLEQRVRREGALTISFSNGSKQVIELAGWLYRPWLSIQMPNLQPWSPENSEIDFGTVHFKNSKKLSFYLLNPSKVDARFNIAYLKYQQSIKYKFEQTLWTPLDYEDQTITDEKKCWRLSADSGVVRNRTLPVHYMPSPLALPSPEDHFAETHKPLQVTVLFKPEANVLYKSKFRVTVAEGLSFDIVVKGRGSYEEELEKK